MLRSCRRRMVSAFVAVAGCSTPLYAQTTFDLGPLVGYYRPLGSFEMSTAYSTSLPIAPSELSTMTRGGTAHITFGRRLGVEGQLAIAHSTIGIVNTPAGPRERTDALEVVVMLRGQYDLSPSPEKYRLWLSAGPGFIQHGGSAYAKFGSPKSLGGALGLGITVPIRYRLQLAAGATALRYRIDVRARQAVGDPVSLQRGLQTDALFHLGIGWGTR